MNPHAPQETKTPCDPEAADGGVPCAHSSGLLHRAEQVGDSMVQLFHLVGLFVIGGMVLWASVWEIVLILREGHPSIKDILLLFIYLEMGAMVGIYFRTKTLPVRFLIYIAITALTRVLAIDIKTMTDQHMLMLSISILLLSVAVWVLRYGTDMQPRGRAPAKD